MPPAGWLRVVLRVTAMILWLLLCLAGDTLSRKLGRKRRWPRRFLAGIGAIAGLSVKRHGHPHHGRTLFLANHVSWLDIPALAGTTGTTFVAHEGLASVPLIRWLCRLNDTVFVARHQRGSVHGQVSDVREALADLRGLALFPEGTTSDGSDLLPFKSSLLSAVEPLPPGVAVQPVYLAYRHAPAIAWVGEEHGLTNFLKILARAKPVELVLHFLPPLEGEALANRKTMASAAREAMVIAQGLHHERVLP
jgi:1-acyl-sn-glycerol-3-phosphate acyltransferase